MRYSGEGEDTTLTFTIVDSSPMAAFDLHDPADGLWFYRHILSDGDQIADADGKYRYEVEVPLSEISRAWTDQGGKGPVVANPYVLAWDYGLNYSSAVTVNLPTGNPSIPTPCTDPAGGHWVTENGGWRYVVRRRGLLPDVGLVHDQRLRLSVRFLRLHDDRIPPASLMVNGSTRTPPEPWWAAGCVMPRTEGRTGTTWTPSPS